MFFFFPFFLSSLLLHHLRDKKGLLNMSVIILSFVSPSRITMQNVLGGTGTYSSRVPDHSPPIVAPKIYDIYGDQYTLLKIHRPPPPAPVISGSSETKGSPRRNTVAFLISYDTISPLDVLNSTRIPVLNPSD